jgi:glucose repression mediator protein
VHIKARLQLLQNGQPTNGMPNQNSAPLPQDIHPQAYQPAPVNGPPGPQWGAPPPSQAHQGPPPPAFDYNRRLAEIQHPQAPPQQLHPIGPDPMRDGPRPTGPPSAAPRPLSPPRQEQMRPYQEPQRPNVAGPPRRLTPSPKSQTAVPNHYHGQNLPPPPPPPVQQPQGQPGSAPAERRITNPNYGPQSASVPPPSTSGTPHGQVPGYSRAATPPEVRPLNLDRPSSAGGSSYPHQHYSHHPNASGPSSIASGAPAPAAALAAAEAAARDRDDRPLDRPPSSTNGVGAGPKRMREWEDEPVSAKQPNDEKRQRLDDHIARPPSNIPDRASQASPPRPHSIDIDARRRHEDEQRRREEDQRRANENYHPSEAAHHPPSLPALQQPTPTPQPQPQSQSLPRLPEVVKEERPREQHHEPAARRMEVDENYDDDGEDEKRPPAKTERESPKSANPMVVTAGGD